MRIVQMIVAVCFLFTPFSMVFAQWHESFESSQFPPEGWAVINSEETSSSNGFSLAYVGEDGGVKEVSPDGTSSFVLLKAGQEMRESSDSWLLTSSFEVSDASYFNFSLLAVDFNPSVLDTFEVWISETGESVSDFKECLSTVYPHKVFPWNTEVCRWSDFSVDLSSWKGKTVRLAFRNRMYARSAIDGCVLALDNVRLEKEPVSDLSLVRITSPVSSCNPIQSLGLEVYNAGQACQDVQVFYQLNNEPVESYTFPDPIPGGASLSVSLPEPVSLVEGINRFRVWLSSHGEIRWNDTASWEVKIGKGSEFPYIGADSDEGSDFSAGFAYPAAYAWQYRSIPGLTTEPVWFGQGSLSNHLIGPCLDIPKGKVKFSFDVMVTGNTRFLFYRSSDASWQNQETLVEGDVIELSTGFTRYTQILDIPESGWQSLSLSAEEISGSVQVLVKNIRIEVMPENLALASIITPVLPRLARSSQGQAVGVMVVNQGTQAVEGIGLHYQVDGLPVVSEMLSEPLEAGEQRAFVFSSLLDISSLGPRNLRVWISSSEEEYRRDDTISMNIHIYEPLKVPYAMGFEESEDFSGWNVYNPDGNPYVYWMPSPVSVTLPGQGKNVCMVTCLEGSPTNDMLISPAMDLQPGRYRIAFYYAGLPYYGCDMDLTVCLAGEPDPSVLLQNPMRTYEMGKDVWLSAGIPFEVKSAGRYYVGLYSGGVSCDVMIDGFQVDSENDLSLEEIGYLETSGYNKATSGVRIKVRNQGAGSIKGFQAGYAVNGKEFLEQVPMELEPGEEKEYVFSNQADISATGIYHLSGFIKMAGDADSLNNIAEGRSIEHFANRQVPFMETFAEDAHRRSWLIWDANQDGNTWIPAGSGVDNDAYSGKEVMVYSSQEGVDGDDYAFSPCIEVAKGQYQLSFFYRTWKNISYYKEDFSVGIYSGPHPDSLLVLLEDFTQVNVIGQEYKKCLYPVMFEKDTQVYIGFHAKSKKGNGLIFVDDIRLACDSLFLPSYSSDFDARSSEWTVYNQGFRFNQWKFESHSPLPAVAKVDVTNYTYPIGLLVSPGFISSEDEDIRVRVRYHVSVASEDKSKDSLLVYLGHENHPDSLDVILARLAYTDTVQEWVDTVPLRQGKKVYIGMRPLSRSKDDGKKSSYVIHGLDLRPVSQRTFSVYGKVVDPQGKGISSVSVGFVGKQVLSAETSLDGSFRFDDLLGNQKFTILCSAVGYQMALYGDSLVDSSLDMGDLMLKDEARAPWFVAVKDCVDSAIVSWVAPSEIEEFRYDNGKVDNSLGLSNGTLETPLVVAHPMPAILTEIDWFLQNPDGLKNYVTLYILALDENGQPSAKILYRKDNVPNVDRQWNSHKLDYPVECPDGFALGIACDGYLGIACDDGNTEGYPFRENTHFMVGLSDNTISSFEERNIRRNIFLRAKGVRIGASKNLLGYDVVRCSQNNIDDTSSWDFLTKVPLTKTSYVDHQWPSLTPGSYLYGVRCYYSLDVQSDWVFSHVVENQTTGVVHVKVESLQGEGIVAATVRLRGDSLPTYREGETGPDGALSFRAVPLGEYDLSVLKDGYGFYTQKIKVDKESSYEVPLSLSLNAPKNLEIKVVGGRESLCWNHFPDMEDGFEYADGHDVFAINSPGNIGWTYWDRDDCPTMGYKGLSWDGKGSRMAFQVFDPQRTTPVMQGDVYRPHGGNRYLTTFPSYRETGNSMDSVANDDWLISPELKYCGDFDFTFYARSIAPHRGLERMNVWYSVSGNQREDFVKLTAGNYTEVPASWTRFSYHLPATTTYVAVQCVSDFNLQFLLDDASFKARSKGEALRYEVFVDGKMKLLVDRNLCEIQDLGLENGTYELGVRSVYASGKSDISTIRYTRTSVESDLEMEQVRVYPNPVRTLLHVESEQSPVKVRIYSLLGVCMYESQTFQSTFSIDMEQWPDGVYQMVLQDGKDGKLFKKLVK